MTDLTLSSEALRKVWDTAHKEPGVVGHLIGNKEIMALGVGIVQLTVGIGALASTHGLAAAIPLIGAAANFAKWLQATVSNSQTLKKIADGASNLSGATEIAQALGKYASPIRNALGSFAQSTIALAH
jgi:hypothetical protein